MSAGGRGRIGDGRLYLRQFQSGLDFATDNRLATQMANYVYALGDREAGSAVLVDPAYAPLELAGLVRDDGLELAGAVLTHFHADHAGGSIGGRHIDGVAELTAETGCPIHLHGADVAYLCARSAVHPAALVSHRDGDTIELGALSIRLVHTPGHSPGSQCLVTEDLLLTGDTLFLRGCGRSDLDGGDPDALYESLTARLAEVSDDATVYPGHAYAEACGRLGELRRSNPVLFPTDRATWIARFGP